MTASVRFVFSTLVVLDARLPDWLGHTKTTNDGKTRIYTKTVTLFRSVSQTLNSCGSLHHARGSESIIFFNDHCKPIETYINAMKKHSFTSCPAAKHPKHNKLAATNIREKPVDWHRTDVDFISRNNFTNLGSFAKSFSSCRIYNSYNYDMLAEDVD